MIALMLEAWVRGRYLLGSAFLVCWRAALWLLGLTCLGASLCGGRVYEFVLIIGYVVLRTLVFTVWGCCLVWVFVVWSVIVLWGG